MWVYEFEGIMPSNFLSFCPKDLEKGACNDKTKTGQAPTNYYKIRCFFWNTLKVK